MHRDIKSANVFLCTPLTDKPSTLFQAKLGDMNVSKVIKHGMNNT
jgi:hypothetical protein